MLLRVFFFFNFKFLAPLHRLQRGFTYLSHLVLSRNYETGSVLPREGSGSKRGKDCWLTQLSEAPSGGTLAMGPSVPNRTLCLVRTNLFVEISCKKRKVLFVCFKTKGFSAFNQIITGQCQPSTLLS